jgi:uncharacterized protein
MSAEKLDALRKRMHDLDSVLVCFSGGVDSAFVLAVAVQELGDRAAGLTAISPSLAPAERQEAESLARTIGARHLVVESNEIHDPRYAANPTNRCYYCKTELYRIARDVAHRDGFAHVLNGTNRDDLGDYRPGLDAANEAEVLSPLVELGFTKDDVRDGARLVGLSVWDKPAAACLSSRIPYGTSVTLERLTQIGQAEAAIKALGLRQIRVRYHGDVARIEVGAPEIERAFALRREISEAAKRAGFAFVALDLDGYRTGSHNEVVKLKVLHG